MSTAARRTIERSAFDTAPTPAEIAQVKLDQITKAASPRPAHVAAIGQQALSVRDAAALCRRPQGSLGALHGLFVARVCKQRGCNTRATCNLKLRFLKALSGDQRIEIL
jgi:hypothetical protein